jgi:hypothetical protein
MAMFLKFIGPMATLSRGKLKFEKDKIYKFLDDEKAFDALDTGRFQQVRDPTQAPKRGERRGGVRINSRSERGDFSQDDLRRGGDRAQRPPREAETLYIYKEEGSDEEHATTDPDEVLQEGRTFVRKDTKAVEPEKGVEGEVDEIEEQREPEDDHPRLPASQFTSKREAAEWAKKNLGVDLDTKKSIVSLNNTIVEIYTKKFGKKDDPDEVDDDGTREENTKVEAVTVA